ncbi:MAG TPA: DUF503 domain-containing protein [Solirubrobacteraceae bacterium]|jgi:uncharacterized protein YlxP (DUF503 family)|nr:DUF503 domain-containing protein [Solirubrobacteraceae bacterium]
MSDAFVAVLRIDLHFPDAGSLKAKRRDLQSVKAQLQGRMGVAVAEVAHHDAWQRSTLAAAVVAGSAGRAADHADRVEEWLLSRFPETVSVQRALASWTDLAGLG